MAGSTSLKSQMTSGHPDYVDRSHATYKAPFSQYGVYAPALQGLQDARSGASTFSPTSTVGMQQKAMAGMAPAEQARFAQGQYSVGDNPNHYYDLAHGIQEATGAQLAQRVIGARPTSDTSSPVPADMIQQNYVAPTGNDRNNTWGNAGPNAATNGRTFNVGEAQQIGAPMQHSAPLSAPQGGGLRASMTATGQGPMIGSAGGGGGPGGQSAPMGNLYAAPDDGTGQQTGQLMGRLMASLFAPK